MTQAMLMLCLTAALHPALVEDGQDKHLVTGFSSIPAPPTNLSATAAFDELITLYWTDNASFEEGIRIERKEGAGAFSEIYIVGPKVESYYDNSVLASTAYTYRVRAYSGPSSSDYSNEASAETTSGAGLEVSVVGPRLIEIPISAPVILRVDVRGATGTANYEWYFDDGSKTPEIVVGAEDDSISLSETGEYWCRVTDDVDSAMSPEVTVLMTSSVPVASGAGLGLMAVAIAFGGAALARRRRSS